MTAPLLLAAAGSREFLISGSKCYTEMRRLRDVVPVILRRNFSKKCYGGGFHKNEHDVTRVVNCVCIRVTKTEATGVQLCNRYGGKVPLNNIFSVKMSDCRYTRDGRESGTEYPDSGSHSRI